MSLRPVYIIASSGYCLNLKHDTIREFRATDLRVISKALWRVDNESLHNDPSVKIIKKKTVSMFYIFYKPLYTKTHRLRRIFISTVSALSFTPKLSRYAL